jgi:hypothetical protein
MALLSSTRTLSHCGALQFSYFRDVILGSLSDVAVGAHRV